MAHLERIRSCMFGPVRGDDRKKAARVRTRSLTGSGQRTGGQLRSCLGADRDLSASDLECFGRVSFLAVFRGRPRADNRSGIPVRAARSKTAAAETRGSE